VSRTIGEVEQDFRTDGLGRAFFDYRWALRRYEQHIADLGEARRQVEELEALVPRAAENMREKRAELANFLERVGRGAAQEGAPDEPEAAKS
jgi:hypothetical protein